MTMKVDLRARLLADAALAARVANRIDWQSRPQGDALPSVTLQVVSDPRPQHMKGFQDLRATRVQADVWGGTDIAVSEIADLLIAAVAPPATQGGTRFSRTFIDSATDLPERLGNTTINRTSLDLIVHHATA